MEGQEYEWISVSDYAQRAGVTTQTIRNYIKKGLLETMEFKRGVMRGVLVKALKQ